MEQVKEGIGRRILRNIATSWELTKASLRMVTSQPKVLLMPFATLIAVTLMVVIPLSLLIWTAKNAPDALGGFFKTLYFITVMAAEKGNWSLAWTSAVVETYLLFSLWMIPVLTAVLYFTTVGMHVATQQIKRQTPDLGAAFRVANKNFMRIVALAAFSATVYTWVRYLVFTVVRVIPVVGRWIMRGLRLVLSAVTYLMLPIVIYERAGARAAFRSAWNQVKQTWSGLLIGSGLIFFATFALFEVFAWGVARHVIGAEGAAVLTLIAAAVFYSVSCAVAAALRASLYWYATTGEVPPGFREEYLPQISERHSFTGIDLSEGEAKA